jgi:hypothetical protein
MVQHTSDCGAVDDVGGVDAAPNANLQNDHVRLRLQKDLQTCQTHGQTAGSIMQCDPCSSKRKDQSADDADTSG